MDRHDHRQLPDSFVVELDFATARFSRRWSSDRFRFRAQVGVLVIALTPSLLRESSAEVAHRHVDLAGAASAR